MKIITVITFCLVFAYCSARAADVDARFLRFSGEVPNLQTLVNLMESGAIGNPVAFSTALKADNSFDYHALKPNEYPTEFTADSKPAATGTRNTGITFSGQVKPAGDDYTLDLAFKLVERADTLLYSTKTGGTIAQPVFAQEVVQKQIVLHPGEWNLVPIKGEAEKQLEHCVLLVRVRR